MTSVQREQYDRFPSNLTRTLLLLDERLARALPEAANALRASGLDATLREAIILRVAALSDSAYERMQHLDQARQQGWSDDDIEAIETDHRARLPAHISAVLAFTDACFESPVVAPEIFARARDVLSDQDLVTLIALIGHYMAVARLTGTLEVDLDEQADAWTQEH